MPRTHVGEKGVLIGSLGPLKNGPRQGQTSEKYIRNDAQETMHENWKRQAVGLSVTCCYYDKTDEVISLIKGKVCFDRISVQNCLALFLWTCCHRTSGQEECVREDLFTSWGKKDTDRPGPGSPKSSQEHSSGGLISSQRFRQFPSALLLGPTFQHTDFLGPFV